MGGNEEEEGLRSVKFVTTGVIMVLLLIIQMLDFLHIFDT
jgi:hypothetical protein